MKKNSTVKQSPKRGKVLARGPITIGMDLGDRTSRYCVLDEHGKVQDGVPSAAAIGVWELSEASVPHSIVLTSCTYFGSPPH
jgi:hypothetical protein